MINLISRRVKSINRKKGAGTTKGVDVGEE
jgi:molybdate-binding protein